MIRNFSDRPPLTHSFNVQVGVFMGVDNNFSEVSGISKHFESEKFYSGGDNGVQYNLASKTSHDPLVPKRGVIPSSSMLYEWCNLMVNGGVLNFIVPMPIFISLLDENGVSQVSWIFSNAYPTDLELSEFNAGENNIAIETITFAYSWFERIPI